MRPITLRLGHKAMLCQIIIPILWLPTYVLANIVMPEGGGAANDNTTCRKIECQEIAKMIEKQMGNKTPCEDFHDYVCGNWRGDRELKPAVLKKKAVLTLVGLLERPSWKPFPVSNATNKLIRAYKSCAKKGKDEKALRTSIENVIARYNLTNKTWPITEEAKSPLKESNDYVDVLKNTGPRPVFSYSISDQEGKPVIFMTKPTEFYVFDVEEFDSMIRSDAEEPADSTTIDYSNYDATLDKDEKAYKEFINQTIILLNGSISKERETALEDIIKMEKDLSKLASGAKEAQAQKMNLSQLSHLLGGSFPMTEILQRDFEGLNININGSTEVWVEYIQYFKEAVNLMKCSTTASLSNYILWTKIRKMAEAKGTELHKLYLQFKHNTSVDKSTLAEESYIAGSAGKPRNLSLQCLYQLLESDVMYTAAAHYYIVAKFNKTFKEDVLNMTKFVTFSFIDVVQHNTWMSNHTKKEVIMKLKNMTAIIGYPDRMLNDTIINGLYQYVPRIPKNVSFVEHFHYLVENDFKQSLLQLEPGRYFNKKDEDIPLRSHAYYVGGTNTMVYPAAAIVTHYRGAPIPRSVNYGTIGTILGQLLTKLIDRYDDLSRETGRYNVDTWDNATRDNFCNRSSCLNHTEECNDTQVPNTGKYEKLHDYFGVRISYQAMENSKQNYTPPFLLPDKNKTFDTEENIFFILFGSLYCPYSVNEGLVESRADDKDKFPESLNEIVYNYVAFNKTFNCETTGEDMCDLMPPEPKKPDGC